MTDPDFLEDINSLLHPEEIYNAVEAYQVVKERVIERLIK